MNDKTGQSVMDFSPATKTSHPLTSFIAEQTITKSGRRQRHCDIILRALFLFNGSTSAELAGYLEGILTHPQIWRRRADLINKNRVKVEGVRNGYGIWWIKERQGL